MTLMSLKLKYCTSTKKKESLFKLFQVFMLFILLQYSSQAEPNPDVSIKKISKVNLLLPICQKSNCNEVYAKLVAYNGCYEWKTEDPSLVQIQPIQKPEDDKNCYSEAYVYTKAKSTKDITFVSAKDKKTNEYFKCKVGFGEISRISIEKNFDTINVGDIFELHVLAHDDRGNIFSSLEGWKFNWKIIKGHNNAQLIKLTDDGKVEIGTKREKIEKDGGNSDIMLIKGSQTGKIIVSVDILEDDLKNKVTSDQRELYIVEPFKIIPDKELYIVPNTQYSFDLMYTHSKKVIPKSEHKYFQWSVSDENCGKIKNFGNFYSKSTGCTLKVIAKDTRLEQFNIDEVTVHVLFPNSIDIGYMEINENDKKIIEKIQIENNQLLNFNLSPTFKLVEGKHYVFKNFLMYDDQPVYYNSVNFNFDLSSLNNYVYKNKINYKNNNELATLTANKVMEEQGIQSSVSIEKNNLLVIKKNVIIYEKVRIKKFNMPYFTLPYLGYGSNQNNREIIYGQELYLIVTGGTGHYLYTSSDSEIVDIIQDSYLLSRNKGKANIVVSDKEISSNNDNIDVYVKDINIFTFMEERQEIKIGKNFVVTPIALYQNKKYEMENIFTNCSNIKLSYEQNNEKIAQTQEVFYKNNNSNNKLNKMNRYYQVRNYIMNNVDALSEKLSFIKIKKNTEQYEYMDYANYGICGTDSFVAVEEGLLKLFYKSLLNIKDKFSNSLNINTINSINPANIYIYSEMEIKDIITDNFTKYIIEKNKLENPDSEKNYIIAEGSGIELHLKGGIIPWSGYQNDYMEEKLVIELNNDRTYNADKISKYIKFINKKDKIIYAYCNKKGYEFDFIINVHNKRSLSLINPGESKVKFRISCQNPDHLSMYLLSQTNNFIQTNDFILNEIFNNPQKKGIEYYVKKNSSDIARIYAFDKDKKLFANITSLTGDFEKNKKNRNYFNILEKKSVLENPSKYIKDKDIIGNVYSLDNQEFIQEYILFNDNEIVNSNQNTFELKYNLKNNINNQYIKLQIIDVPEIYPKNVSVYIREDNIYPLTIEKGSGDFSIRLSDESLAKYNYDKNNRKLYITPLRPGILLVKVIDNQLGTGFNYESKSTLYLSDVNRILVYGGGLLMNNKSTVLGIEVFDSFENKFSEDQQKIIPLRLNESFYGLDASFSKDNTKVNITGLTQGLYPIIIKDDSSNIMSNIATIEVFDKLEVYPPYLLLVPGSSFTLSVTGGPKNKENVIIKYEIADDKIANVSENYPEVYGKIYGKTQLKISLLYKYDYNKIYNINDDKHIINKTDLLCVENVPITVDFPDNVEIIGAENNRKIYSKSTIRLLAALKKGSEVFTYGTGPFIFNWDVDNNVVAKIKYFMKKSLFQNEKKDDNNKMEKEYDENCDECQSLSLISTKKDHNPRNSLGVFLSTYEEGIATINLVVTISYPSPYTMHKPYKFSTNSKIVINDELYVDLPGFYGENLKRTGLYLIPYNVDHELHTNKNSEQVYSIIRQHDINDINNKNAKIISMTNSGRVTSYYRNGLAYISISQLNNKDNNVPVILPILVNDFYSIFIEKTHTIIDMEVGQEILLKVIIQHYNGMLFADKFERIPLRAVVSHPLIANVELLDFNSKLRLKAQNIGDTNIVLFHPETRKIYDVFKLNVVQQTTLLNKIVIPIGGTINFFGKDINKKNELMRNGEWISDNSKVMKVDKSGFGTAINEGEATIILKEKNSQKILTSTRVLVRKIYKISFDKTKLPKTFTDIKKNGIEFINKYNIPIILYSYDDEIFTNDENDKLSIINPKIKIKCESDSPYYVQADEINKDNINECIFTIRENKFGDKKSWSKQSEEKPKDINIQLTVEDYYKNKNSVQENVPFSSSFKIKNGLHIINLSYKEREYLIYVDNLNDLDIKISNENLVKIEEINKERKYIKIKIPYSVDEDFKGVILYLANVLTGQKEEITINYNNSGINIGAGSSINGLSDFLFIIVLTCLLLLLGYFLLFSGRKNPNQFMYSNSTTFQNSQNYIPGRGFPIMNANINNGNNFNPNNYNFNTNNLNTNFANNEYNNYNSFNNNFNNRNVDYQFANTTNNNSGFGNNYNNYNVNNSQFSNKRQFNNMMGTNNFSQLHPTGSIFKPNIDMNGPY